MPKPDPALLESARYPFSCEITTRFADLDLNQHINNVALATMIEDARVRFNASLGLLDLLGGRGLMIASIAIDYLAEAHYPRPMHGTVAVERIGRSSWTTVQVLIQDERPVTFARSVLVCIGDQGSSPLPDGLRATLEQRGLR